VDDYPVALLTDWRGLAGPAICYYLARAGYSLLVNGPAEEVLALKTPEVPGTILALPFHPTNEDSIQQIILAGLETFGHIDVLVNNFYAWNDAALAEITEEMWTEVWQTNVKSTFYCCRSVAPVMQAQEYGKIINVTSTSALSGSHLQFAASSAAVHSMTRSLARELAPHVRVNSIACGTLEEPWIDEGGPEVREILTRDIPLARLCTHNDIGEAVLFLATGGDFMTGQMLVIDGGEHMH
jgi:3-oxoacyl-[acyl-carrier protein] reductase